MKTVKYLLVFVFSVVLSLASVNLMADSDHGKKGQSESHGKKDDDHGKKDEDHGKKDEDHGKKNEDHGKKDDDHLVVGVCHNTDDPDNPVVFLTVSAKAAAKHESNHGDLVGVGIESIDDCYGSWRLWRRGGRLGGGRR